MTIRIHRLKLTLVGTFGATALNRSRINRGVTLEAEATALILSGFRCSPASPAYPPEWFIQNVSWCRRYRRQDISSNEKLQPWKYQFSPNQCNKQTYTSVSITIRAALEWNSSTWYLPSSEFKQSWSVTTGHHLHEAAINKSKTARPIEQKPRASWQDNRALFPVLVTRVSVQYV